MATRVHVDACLPLRVRPVASGEVARRRKAVLGGPQVREPNTSSLYPRYERMDVLGQIVSRLEGLEAKIDGLVALVLLEQQRRARHEAVNLELHGEGLTFRWPTALTLHEVMELDLGLMLFPPREITFVAQVEQCQIEEGEDAVQPHYLVSARFIAINEADRDEIHRFMINAQRQQRRTTSDSRKTPG